MRRAKANVSQLQSLRHGSGDASSASDGSTLAITFIVALSKHPDVNVHISVTVGEMAGDTKKRGEKKRRCHNSGETTHSTAAFYTQKV